MSDYIDGSVAVIVDPIRGVVADNQKVSGVVEQQRSINGVISSENQIYSVVEPPKTLAGTVSKPDDISGAVQSENKISGVIIESGSSTDPYEGAYEATSLANEEQTLETRGKKMKQDVTIHKIPYTEVENIGGGYTATIAS